MYFLASFLRRNDQKKKIKIGPKTKSLLPLVFFPSSGWFVCFDASSMKETLLKSLSTFVFRTHTNAGGKVLATSSRRMPRRQSAHRCTPGTFRRSMRAFDGVERAVLGDEFHATRRCECCAFLVRFLVAFFLLPLEEEDKTILGERETKKKHRNPVGKRPARKRRERTFLTVVFFGAAVFFFVAAAALICKANAIL